MKMTLRYLSLNAQATWHGQVEEQLKHLHSLEAALSPKARFTKGARMACQVVHAVGAIRGELIGE